MKLAAAKQSGKQEYQIFEKRNLTHIALFIWQKEVIILELERIIQVYVPGREISMGHLISNPTEDTITKLGIMSEVKGSIGIMKISPSEAAIILVDLSLKAADVEIGFMDRFSGTVVITGNVEAVHTALKTTLHQMKEVLDFNHIDVTRS